VACRNVCFSEVSNISWLLYKRSKWNNT